MNGYDIMKLGYMTNGLVKTYCFSNTALMKSHFNGMNKNWPSLEVFMVFFFKRKLAERSKETICVISMGLLQGRGHALSCLCRIQLIFISNWALYSILNLEKAGVNRNTAAEINNALATLLFWETH